MRIDGHRLVGAGVQQRRSPNDGGAFAPGAPDTLILHYTALPGVEAAVERLTDPTPGNRVSAHLLIGRDGGITQLLPFDTVGWHAGRSSWGGRSEFNAFSLGLEIDNAGRLQPAGDAFVDWQGHPVPADEAVAATHRNEAEPAWWHAYPPAQVRAVESVCRLLTAAYRIGWILGHEEIAPQRKDDPGPAFPLDELRRRVLGAPLAAYDGGPPPA